MSFDRVARRSPPAASAERMLLGLSRVGDKGAHTRSIMAVVRFCTGLLDRVAIHNGYEILVDRAAVSIAAAR